MTVEKILQTLKSRGYRTSGVRRDLLTALGAGEKLGAEDLRDQLMVRRGYRPDRSTVYRELEMLVREGFVNELDFGEGKKRYELSDGSHHHHVYCRRCERIECVDVGQHLSQVEQAIQAATQFQIQAHHLEFFGLCADCQQAV